MDRIERGQLTISEGAQVLGLSRRQMKRLRRRVRVMGQEGIVHGNTGRAPKHKTGALVLTRVVQLRRRKYAGFNDQHFAEKLREVEELVLSVSTVRRALRLAGIESVRHRRPPKHRRRRDRRPQAGQMILWDGSRHDWLEGRGPRLCLMGAIDDATGQLLPGAHFVDQECTIGYLRVLRDIVKDKGAPLSAYMDRHGALKRNDKHWSLEEQLAGKQEPTQVKRALDDLGIQAIYALSPQAKGRVERLWGTLQDRLTSELRLAGASTVGEANRIVELYRSDHNARFAIAPQDANPAWRPLGPEMTADEACALQYARRVLNNNTVRVGREVIDIPAQPRRGTFAKANVLVRHLLNGEYRVYFRGELVAKRKGLPPTEPRYEPRTIRVALARSEAQRKKAARSSEHEGFDDFGDLDSAKPTRRADGLTKTAVLVGVKGAPSGRPAAAAAKRPPLTPPVRGGKRRSRALPGQRATPSTKKQTRMIGRAKKTRGVTESLTR
ncbi:MAG: ISNCY family transposase [Byssovorax sp.]